MKNLIILFVMSLLLFANISLVYSETNSGNSNTVSSPSASEIIKSEQNIGSYFGFDSNKVKITNLGNSDLKISKSQDNIILTSNGDLKLDFLGDNNKVSKTFEGFQKRDIGENKLVFDKNGELIDGTDFKTGGGKNKEQEIQIKGYNFKLNDGDSVQIKDGKTSILTENKITKPEKVKTTSLDSKTTEPIFKFKTGKKEVDYIEGTKKKADMKGTINFRGEQAFISNEPKNYNDLLTVDKMDITSYKYEKVGSSEFASGELNLFFDGKEHNGDYISFGLDNDKKTIIMDLKKMSSYITFNKDNPFFGDEKVNFAVDLYNYYSHPNNKIIITKDSTGVSVDAYGNEFDIYAGDKRIPRYSNGVIGVDKHKILGDKTLDTPNLNINIYDKINDEIPSKVVRVRNNNNMEITDYSSIPSDERSRVIYNPIIGKGANMDSSIMIKNNIFGRSLGPAGSGTIISIDSKNNEAYVLSAAHCFIGGITYQEFEKNYLREGWDQLTASKNIYNVKDNKIELFDRKNIGEEIDAKLLATDLSQDIALLKVKIPEGMTLSSSKIGDTFPEGSDNLKSVDVTCIGCGGGNPPYSKPGELLYQNKFVAPASKNAYFVKSNIYGVMGGDSGGGVFDANGKLVGIISTGENEWKGETTGFTYLVPVETIRKFLDNKGYSALYKFVFILIR